MPSLTLGTIGVHMLDLAGAYGGLADGGLLAPPYLIDKITGPDGKVIYDHGDEPAPKQVDQRAVGVPGHGHPGRQHRPGQELDLGRALPAHTPMAAAVRQR